MDEELLAAASPLEQLMPGVSTLPGTPSEEQLGGPLFRHLRREEKLSWGELGRMSPLDITQVSHVGPVRAKRVLSNVSALLGDQSARMDRSQRVASSSVDDEILDAVRVISAWSVGTGRGGSLLDALVAAVGSNDADTPRPELEALAAIGAVEVADPDRIARYDPVRAAEMLLDGFDERQRATFDRLLDFDGSAPTLQELGEQFGVTRERIRQIESKVRQQLTAALTDARFASLVTAADRLRDRLGAAVPADELAGEFAEYPPDLLDRLILHLAGPYRFDGDWYVLQSMGSFDVAVMESFESAATHGVTKLDAFGDALVEMGVRDEFVDRVVIGDRRLRVVGDDVVDWTGSLATKAAIALQRSGAPMQFDELVAFVGPNSERGMSNQVHADERIVKVGVNRFALAEWDLDVFEGIAPTMMARLEDGPRETVVLGEELAEEFGVSPNSVNMLAGQHPAFLLEDGVVMLRPAGRPYEPFTDLVRTRCCYVIEGVWSWRVPVDHDLLRGSGRQLSEAFAVHLGVSPLESGSVDSPVGSILVNWRQYPTIGSMRSLARSLDAEEGDWMFVRRVSPSAIDATLVRAGDVPEDPDGAIRALVGAPDATGDLEKVLADALGLRGTVNHDLTEERDLLTERREHDLVTMMEALGQRQH